MRWPRARRHLLPRFAAAAIEQYALARAFTLILTLIPHSQLRPIDPQPQPQPSTNIGLSLFGPNSKARTSTPAQHLGPRPQVARLQRELYRERRIMENEGAGSGPTNAKRIKRRSTNIGHRFGSGRGPLVLKATLHHGDVNTAVGFGRTRPSPSALCGSSPHACPAPCAGDALDRRLGRGAPAHIAHPNPETELSKP